MAISIKVIDRNSSGKWWYTFCQCTLDNSYPFGGYVITPSQVGLGQIYGAQIFAVNAAPGLTADAQWDTVNGKLLIYRGSSAVLQEEVVTIAANVGTLANIPGYIIAINVTAGGTTGAFQPIPVGTVPTTKQVAVNFATGGLTFLGTDAVTSVKITYFPLGYPPFITANLVIDEVLAPAATANLANQCSLTQYTYNTTAGNLPTVVGNLQAPASGQVRWNYDNSTNSTLTVNAGQSGNSYKVTYYKRSGLGALFGYTTQVAAGRAVTSNVQILSAVEGSGGILVPGFGCQIPSQATATPALEVNQGPSGTAAANVCVYNMAAQTITYVSGDAITTNDVGGFIILNEASQSPLQQVNGGVDLSAMVANLLFFGPK